MGRVLVVLLLLSLSLTAFAQTTAPPATADTIPARVNLEPAPLVVPGATTPIYVISAPAPNETSVAVPDYGVATPLIPSGPPPSAVRPAETPAAADTTPVNSGFISYSSETPAPAGPAISVADAAAQYRTSKTGVKSRVIDNTTLSTLDRNPSGLVNANELTMPQGDISPEEEAALRNAKPEFAAAGDVLDPRDFAAVEAAVRRGDMQHNPQDGAAAADPRDAASAQYEQMTQEAEAEYRPSAEPRGEVVAPSPTQAEGVPQQSEAVEPDQRERLPESSSALPFVALLGFIALAGGAVSVLRARA